MTNFKWSSDAGITWSEKLLELLAVRVYKKEMDGKGNNMKAEHWNSVCEEMNNLFLKGFTTPLTPTIAKSRLGFLKSEYKLFCKVFTSGDGVMIDTRLDETAWAALIEAEPKLNKYKDPANAFPYYQQMNDMFAGKFAEGHDAYDINKILDDDTSSTSVASISSLSLPSKDYQKRPLKKKSPLGRKKRKGNLDVLDSIAIAMKEMVGSKSKPKVTPVDTAMNLLEEMGVINPDVYVKAVDYLGDEKAAQTFVAMPLARRKIMLTAKCDAIFVEEEDGAEKDEAEKDEAEKDDDDEEED